MFENKETQITKTAQELEEKGLQIDRIVENYSVIALAGAKHMTKALKMAEGVELLKVAMDSNIIAKIKAGMNTRLGFLTDRRHPQTYDDYTIKNCLIEALLKGAYANGNEFNIIAGNTYFTKEFFIRAMRELKSLKNYYHNYQVVKYDLPSKRAYIKAEVSFVYNNEEHKYTWDIPLKYYGDSTTDENLFGKAERKVRAKVYSMLMDMEYHTTDETEEDIKALETTRKASFIEGKQSIKPPAAHVLEVKAEAKTVSAFEAEAIAIEEKNKTKPASKAQKDKIKELLIERLKAKDPVLANEAAIAPALIKEEFLLAVNSHKFNERFPDVKISSNADLTVEQADFLIENIKE